MTPIIDDLDFESTLSTFLEHNLTDIVTFIINSDGRLNFTYMYRTYLIIPNYNNQ